MILLLTIGWLFIRLQSQSNKLHDLQSRQAEMASQWRAEPIDQTRIPASGPDPVIVIKILNPAELAANESPFAGTINNFAPEIIKSIVYKTSSEILREELAKRGVQTEIRVHGLD